METYSVEFTTTFKIEAENRDQAARIATYRLEEELQTEGSQQFYMYINGKEY